MCVHADALWRSLVQHQTLLEPPGCLPCMSHGSTLTSFFNVCLWKPGVSHSSSLIMRFIYHQPWNNHSRFIFPELHSFKRLTAVSVGQLESRISVTQHIASNCMWQREWSDEGNKSGSANNKSRTCVALGRWCCCFSGRKTKSLADNTVLFRQENLPLPSQQSIRSNATASITLQKSEVFDVKMPTGNVFSD